MNKKFSTLMALALLAGSASAQYSLTNWKFTSNTDPQGAYRTFEATSPTEGSTESSSGTFISALESSTKLRTGGSWSENINYLNADHWYQLVVRVGEGTGEVKGLLIQERDYVTGKVYLRIASTNEDAPLNASLWKIEYTKEDGVSGGYFRYVNKETGLALTYDHSIVPETNNEVLELREGIDEWSWYTVNKQVANFTSAPVYSYLHNQSNGEVMYLALVNTSDVWEDGTASDLYDNLEDNGYKGRNLTSTDDYLVKPKVISSTAGGTFLNAVDAEILKLTPVTAKPFFMTAQDFNTRMDADMRTAKDTFSFKIEALSGLEVKGMEPFVDHKFTAVENMFNWTNTYNLDKRSTLNTDGKAFASDTKTFWPIHDRYSLSFEEDGKYLMVDTARYMENLAPSESPAVKFKLNTPKTTDNDYMKARYMFRATYFPTNDSIVIEPLNAAVQADFEWKAKKSWATSAATTSFARIHDYSKANTFVNDFDHNNSKTVSLTTTQINGLGEVLTVAKDNSNEFRVKTSIHRPFHYLKRATFANGLYSISLANEDAVARERAKGMRIVHNMGTRLMYDTQAQNQDYSLMPSTMWVIEQEGCKDAEAGTAKYVSIANREYGADDNEGSVFDGQLYVKMEKDNETPVLVDGKKVYFFIDRSAQYMIGYDNVGWINKTTDDENKLRVKDEFFIEAIDEEIAYSNENHGYKKFDKDMLEDGVENNFQIYWNNNYNNLFLKHVDDQNISVTDEGEATTFEIAKASLPDNQGTVESSFGAYLNTTNTTVPQLKREAYLLKVKDANLIDNDQLYLASVKDKDGRYYYKAMKFDELDNYDAKLAVVYLKADQIVFDGETRIDTAYVLVDINKPSTTVRDLKDLSTYELLKSNGWMKVAVEPGTEMSMLRDNNLEDQPNDVSDAFFSEGNPVKQYIDIVADNYTDLNGNVKIYSKLAQNNYLFEDCNDANNVHPAIQDINPDFHYLGIESKGLDVEKRAALYVDEVVKDNANMQRYLFGVRVDSIADGFICDHSSRIHGYWDDEAIAEDDGEVHFEAYNGYTAGWFLVNLEDSIIANNTNMMHNADLYKFNGYTRLGFVEGIHMVDGDNEYLYVVNPGYELKDLMTIKDNSVTPQAKYTAPGYVLDSAKLVVSEVLDETRTKGQYVTRHDIAGNVNTNHTFSLRRTASGNEGTTSESEPFLLESYLDGVSQIGSFNGAWVKSENGIPVLAKLDTQAGDHEWEDSTIEERIGQSGVFYFETTTDEATANDEITASEVKVIAGAGQITINGAAGKKVVVSNILGQVVTNTVLTSDNATIAAPQGVVVVAVEGEEAVKAIVK